MVPSGLAYEALNDVGHSDRDIVMILNDNEVSVAQNVEAMSRYLNQVQRNSNVQVVAHGVQDRDVYAASRAHHLAGCGLDAAGIAAGVRTLTASEAMAG